jgi:hypothetical protein
MPAIKVGDLVRILIGEGDECQFGMADDMFAYKNELGVVTGVSTGQTEVEVSPLIKREVVFLPLYPPSALELLPYKLNPKLPRSVYAEAPKDATHYNKFRPSKFLRKVGRGSAYFSASRIWVKYHTNQGKVDLAAAEPLYLPTFRVNPYDVGKTATVIIVDGSSGDPVAPVYQTRQELLDENVSLENQVEKLQLRINKKKAFWEANARKITAWAVILDT